MENVEFKYITNLSVPDVDPNRYRVESIGEIYDTLKNRYLGHIIDDEGYHRVAIHTKIGFKSRYLHRIVKIEFDGYDLNPNKNQIDHLDCDKSHNFISNLEWVTKEENARRAIKNNLYYQFDVKMTEEDVEFVCSLLKQGKSYKYISDILFPKYNQSTVGMIGKIYREERWKNISVKYLPFPKLEKSYISNFTISDEIVENICMLLDAGKNVIEIDEIIRKQFDIDSDLKYCIDDIRKGKLYEYISQKYNFYNRKGINMAKPQIQQNDINFEESIKNYGSKIEHIESFVEAVRKFPGK